MTTEFKKKKKHEKMLQGHLWMNCTMNLELLYSKCNNGSDRVLGLLTR